MNFEKQFFEAIANKLLEDGANDQESPIRRFINNWAEVNRAEIMKEVAKKVSIEELAAMVTTKVKSSLNSSYWGEVAFKEDIKRETIRQLACENVKVITEKWKDAEGNGEIK